MHAFHALIHILYCLRQGGLERKQGLEKAEAYSETVKELAAERSELLHRASMAKLTVGNVNIGKPQQRIVPT